MDSFNRTASAECCRGGFLLLKQLCFVSKIISKRHFKPSSQKGEQSHLSHIAGVRLLQLFLLRNCDALVKNLELSCLLM